MDYSCGNISNVYGDIVVVWKDILLEESKKSYFQELDEFLTEDSKRYTIYPETENIFRALKLTELRDVKVVLIVQYLTASGTGGKSSVGNDTCNILDRLAKAVNGKIVSRYKTFEESCKPPEIKLEKENP